MKWFLVSRMVTHHENVQMVRYLIVPPPSDNCKVRRINNRVGSAQIDPNKVDESLLSLLQLAKYKIRLKALNDRPR